MKKYNLLTYDEAVELTKLVDSPFIESKLIVDGYNVSAFNYRLAQYSDFRRSIIEIESKEGLIIKINGDSYIDDKPIKDMSDEELISIGFDKLSKFKIQ
jgi:hypothetical protein